MAVIMAAAATVVVGLIGLGDRFAERAARRRRARADRSSIDDWSRVRRTLR